MNLNEGVQKNPICSNKNIEIRIINPATSFITGFIGCNNLTYESAISKENCSGGELLEVGPKVFGRGTMKMNRTILQLIAVIPRKSLVFLILLSGINNKFFNLLYF